MLFSQEQKTQIVKTAPRASKLSAFSDIPLKSRKHYQKYQNLAEKVAFRLQIKAILGNDYPAFKEMAKRLNKDGVILFREFIDYENFSKLVAAYDEKMKGASKSEIKHDFLNFKNQTDFLTNNTFNAAFFHPLLITLIAYEMGGPIQLVDIRGKDAEPTLTVERDNGPHVDDSLYFRELKLLLAWEKGENRGPKGQNFVALAGSHHLVRNRATEHGANFKKPEDIVSEVFNNPHLKNNIFVIEAEDAKPMTILFEASALIHHRFRTDEKPTHRSCVILAFHTEDGHAPEAYMTDLPKHINDLERFLFSGHAATTLRERTDYFLAAITQQKTAIGNKLQQVTAKKSFVPAQDKIMSKKQLKNWLTTLKRTPTLNDTKPRFSANEHLSAQKFLERFLSIEEHDKHHDLDLIIYPDRSERIRKGPRTRIRERSLQDVLQRQHTMRRFSKIDPSQIHFPVQILAKTEITLFAKKLCDFIARLPILEMGIKEDLLAIKQLAQDLGEAFEHCETTQVLRTNTLFLYWTLDEVYEKLHRLPSNDGLRTPIKLDDIDEMALVLLQQYAQIVIKDDFEYEAAVKNTPSEKTDTFSDADLKHVLTKEDFHQKTDLARIRKLQDKISAVNGYTNITNRQIHIQLKQYGFFSNTKDRKESYRYTHDLSRDDYRKYIVNSVSLIL